MVSEPRVAVRAGKTARTSEEERVKPASYATYPRRCKAR